MGAFPKMNQSVKKRWVKALRSGRYKQGAGELRIGVGRSSRFCCLGVLCAVTRVRGYAGLTMLPSDVAEKHGLSNKHGSDSPQGKLANMNDGAVGRERKDFKAIATWIEKHL